MSVITGTSLNAVHLAIPSGAQVLPVDSDNTGTAFVPITETEQTDKGRNRTGEQPSREGERQVQAKSEKQQDQGSQQQSDQDETELLAEQEEIRTLKQTDREVKDHEQAHRAVGGKYAGPMVLTYERGPDGVNYAVAGEVQVSVSEVQDDPQATIVKAEQIRRAALAPANPSQQDRAVALQATEMIVDAEQQLRQESVLNSVDAESTENDTSSESQSSAESTTANAGQSTDSSVQGLFKSTRKIHDQLMNIDNYQQDQAELGSNLDLIV